MNSRKRERFLKQFKHQECADPVEIVCHARKLSVQAPQKVKFE